MPLITEFQICWKVFEVDVKVGTLWLLSSPICVSPPCSHPLLPSPPLSCLCFGLPPCTSSVFVSRCINSVMVMSGMCINSDLPYPSVPPYALSLPTPPTSPRLFSFIPARLFSRSSLFLSPLSLPFVSTRDPWPQNSTHNQDLLVCACAVGVATCFAAPVGGKCQPALPNSLRFRSPVSFVHLT